MQFTTTVDYKAWPVRWRLKISTDRHDYKKKTECCHAPMGMIPSPREWQGMETVHLDY